MESLIKAAEDFARAAHSGQKRKDGKEYFTHVEAVSRIAVEMFGARLESEKLAIVGLLHDTIEDCGVFRVDIGKTFGEDVADAVELLSRSEGENYFKFIQRLIESENTIAMAVKIADLIHNLSDSEEGSRADKYRFALDKLTINMRDT